jgi:hypothetical protein
VITFAPSPLAPSPLDKPQKIVKQIIGVVRPRRCLGMILHAEHGMRPVSQPFNRSVVQVQVRHLDVRRQRVRIDREAVVL